MSERTGQLLFMHKTMFQIATLFLVQASPLKIMGARALKKMGARAP